MKVRYRGFEAEVEAELVSVGSLVDQAVVVELLSDYMRVCEGCPVFAESKGQCCRFPFCGKIQVRQLTVPKYETGEIVHTERGDKVVYRMGEPCGTYAREKFVTGADGKLRPVKSEEYLGFEVLKDSSGPNKVRVEMRKAFEESTKLLDIGAGDVFPTGVAKNFLPNEVYELIPKAYKKSAETLRNARQLYEIVKALAADGVAVKLQFVWKAGTYKSWAVVLEPMLLDGGLYDLVMTTTGARLQWKHAQQVPPEVAPIEENKAPTVNNLGQLGAFLEEQKVVRKTAIPAEAAATSSSLAKREAIPAAGA
jgi:hypothetical protein